MSSSTRDHDPEVFLQQAGWLRALASGLVRPEDTGDLVQDTYVRFASTPPRHLDSPRGWLGRVARSVRGMTARARQRRALRESASTAPQPWPDPDEVAVRAQRLRLLLDAVDALDEPLRTIVLLHYFEGLSLAEIARQQDCPSATVRGRLRTALTRLREDLDARHGGQRADWLSAFAPFLAEGGITTESVAGTSTIPTLAMGLGAVVLSAGCAAFVLRSPKAVTAQASAPQPMQTQSSEARVQPSPNKKELPTQRTRTPEEETASHFRSPEEREARLAAVHRARIARLEAADMSEEFIAELAADEDLLGIMESMMLMEDAARFATACAEETPPQARGKLFADVEFIGEPDVGTVIETVTLDSERSTAGMGEFATCVKESLFMLSPAPPAAGGTQTKTLFFDTTKTPVLTGTEIRPSKDVRRHP